MNNQLSEKQKIEKNYHDKKYRENINPSVFDNRALKAYRFYWSLIGDVSGLKVLDFGCGNGWLSILLSKRGGKMWGIDISEELIKQANQSAAKEELTEKISFQEMSAENLTFKSNFFNLIIGSAILHHTDIRFSINNLHRVLKPCGRAIFIEPMNQNIFLKIWRKLTPWRRSPTEKALTYEDLKNIQNIFPDAKFYFFSLVSIFSQGLLLLSPQSRLLFFLNDLLERFDSLFLRIFPFIGRYSAVIVMELIKENGK